MARVVGVGGLVDWATECCTVVLRAHPFKSWPVVLSCSPLGRRQISKDVYADFAKTTPPLKLALLFELHTDLLILVTD